MTMFGLIVEAAVLLLLLVQFVMSTLIDRRVAAASPRGIAAQLQRAGSHTVKMRARAYTWNPSQPPGSDNRLYGPGTATYRSGADGTVQLHFVDAGGHAETLTGPLPAEFGKPSPDAASPYAFAKPLFGIVGAAVGWLIANGGTKHRLLIAGAFALAGWILAAIFVMTTSMVTRTRAFAAQRP